MTTPEEVPDFVPGKRRRGWLLVAVVVIGVATVVGFVLTTGSGGTDDTTTGTPLEFADAIRTDLEEIATYDGTLGSIEGDPVQSQLSGTITAAADAGETVTSGDVLYEVDGEPVVLLTGAIPAYRTMTAIEETVPVTAGAAGTVTATPEAGTFVQQGDVLYEVDGRPVILLYGEVPFYRVMLTRRPTSLVTTSRSSSRPSPISA